LDLKASVHGNVPDDSGPLVALLNLRDEHHEWAREQFKHFSDPLLTCEGAITEATHMLQFDGLPPWGVFGMIERKIVAVQFDSRIKSRPRSFR